MTRANCFVCHGLGWVCENHPDRAWSEDGCQCGAGMACECNRVEGIVEEVEGEPTSTGH